YLNEVILAGSTVNGYFGNTNVSNANSALHLRKPTNFTAIPGWWLSSIANPGFAWDFEHRPAQKPREFGNAAEPPPIPVGTVEIEGNSTVIDDGTVGTGSGQIASGADVILDNGGDLLLNGRNNTVHNLTLSSSGVADSGTGTLTVSGDITGNNGGVFPAQPAPPDAHHTPTPATPPPPPPDPAP